MKGSGDYAAILQRMKRFCADRERSPAELRSKISSLGIPEEELELMIRELAGEGFIDEERYARSFIQAKLFRYGWGMLKIRAALHESGTDEAIITRVVSAIDAEEYEDQLKKILRNMSGKDSRTNPEKIIAFMVKRGFEEELVRKYLKT